MPIVDRYQRIRAGGYWTLVQTAQVTKADGTLVQLLNPATWTTLQTLHGVCGTAMGAA